MALETLLMRLKGTRKAGKSWMACCPAHDDHTPSLGITEASDGKVLIHCFAGCKPGEVVEAVGLSMKDLFGREASPDERRRIKKAAAMATIRDAQLVIEAAKSLPLSAEDRSFLAKTQAQGAQAQQLLDRLAAEEGCERKGGLILRCARDIQPEPVSWLWPGWLALGKLAVLAGNPGSGKTTLSMALAAIVTNGGTWPDGSRCVEPGRVLIWSSEDDPADTLVPRLLATGANLECVHFLSGIAEADGLRSFDPSRDIPHLAAELETARDVRLIIIDPIVSAVAGDAHKANIVRRSLQPLVDYAMKHGCAVIGITHFAKGSSERDPLERVIGSQAFGALARVVLVAAKEEGEHGIRVLARAKSNIGLEGGGVSYAMRTVELENGITTNNVEWTGTLEGSARAILGEVEGAQEEGPRAAREQAAEWLSDLITINGPLPSSVIHQKAQGAGISKKSLRTARETLGIVTQKAGFAKGWEWSLPGPSTAKMPSTGEHAQAANEGTFKLQGHLRTPITPMSYGRNHVKPPASTLGTDGDHEL